MCLYSCRVKELGSLELVQALLLKP